MKTLTYNEHGKIYTSSEIGFTLQYAGYNDIDLIVDAITDGVKFVGNAKKLYYANIPCAFDIESTSFDENGEKRGVMYVWQFGICGFCVLGRFWWQFDYLIKRLEKRFNLGENRRLIVYIHNLSFEFQFIRKMFQWSKVFSIEERRPLYALTKGGIEFRCSYMLSGYSLETVAKNLTKYKIAKLVGNLDYTLIRHSQTELTAKEIEYCVNDIKIVMLYIREYLENVRNIHAIPLTKTAAVRKFCRKGCFFVKTDNGKTVNNWRYKHEIKQLKIKNLHEFNALQRAFSGGFTHSNAVHTNVVLENVASYDFTSSYPAVMVTEKFPNSVGVCINVKNNEQFENLINRYHCVFDIEFFDLCAAVTFENYISVSKCMVKEQCTENNGRIVAAKRIVITLTEIDYKIIRKLYTFSKYRIGYLYAYDSGYLPTEFVSSILELYKKKTELKGVDGKENEYLNSKEMLNSCYGMCVTNPLRDEILYDNSGVWCTKELGEYEKTEMLTKYNLSEQRFLYYIWGVYVTAYARRNLFTAIYELKDDYIYSDTDSVKFLNYEKHTSYFENYNKRLMQKLRTACEYHNIDIKLCNPLTIKGKHKLLGAWDFEGIYLKFKTLGAKRYMVQSENALTVDGVKYDYSLTVSGINKKKTIPYLLDKYGKNGIFAAFDNYLYIPPQYSGKNLVTYIDYETSGEICDYRGVKAQYNELSSTNLSSSEFTLNLAAQYINYLKGITEYKH